MSVQSMQALGIAEERRMAMAMIKKNVAALDYHEGCELVSDLLLYPTGHVPAMRVAHLLGAIRRVGPRGAQGWLSRVDIRSHDRRVSELSERQRLALSSAVRKGRVR